MEYSDDLFGVTAGGFSLAGLLLAFALIATFLFTVYWLWGCSSSQSDEIETRDRHSGSCSPILQKQAVVPLYAFELEPGTLVLQSADGEIFRILREYDSVGRTGRGTPPSYTSAATCSSNEYHYMPSYTRAHFQNTHNAHVHNAPSAPEWSNAGGRDSRATQPTSDAGFGEEAAWAPVVIQN